MRSDKYYSAYDIIYGNGMDSVIDEDAELELFDDEESDDPFMEEDEYHGYSQLDEMNKSRRGK